MARAFPIEVERRSLGVLLHHLPLRLPKRFFEIFGDIAKPTPF